MVRRRAVLGAASVVLATTSLLYLLLSWRRPGIYDIERTPSPTDSRLSVSPTPPFLSANHTTKRVLIVSGLFHLKKSKHAWDYYQWVLGMFLGQITTDIYFFTSPDFEQRVREVHANSPASSSFLRVNTTYATPFAVPPLEGLERPYKEIHGRDRERKKHGPELYAVWNAKPFFTDAAVKELRREGREYDYVFWVDAGTFNQGHTYAQWPDPRRVDEFFQEAEEHRGGRGLEEKDKIIVPVYNIPSYWYRFWNERMGPIDFEFSKGSFFGGSPSAVEWYSNAFYAYHDHFLARGYFVGKDQTIINALLLLFPHRFALQWRRDPRTAARFWPEGKCGSEWYYYMHVLASESERDAMEKMWKERMNGWDRGKNWRKIHELHPDAWRRCPISPALSMQTVAEDVFGYGWERDRTSVVSR
ncbi:hypothetical protein FA13DRAFT_718722 [Coprinellus micaceus]|uniref:Uncharacterized protein n=1 Tax=Coprinellus micaceus TaxID=71717 RepID=A0A4Y7TVX2_COPMI|nr:hypothetical protein FA13DRAFT_718722 [Coprinellus micaceus]